MQDKKPAQKPITMIRDELNTEIIRLCNDSKLPFFIIEGILKELLENVHRASIQQLALDKQSYTEACSALTEETPHP